MKLPPALSANAWILALGFALVGAGLSRNSPGQGGGTGGQGGQTPPETQVRPMLGGATADSNGRMIAVTGVDITGASILYVIDSVHYQLAVYQATGGAESTHGLRLVGARRIDLDLRLHGLNDRSRYSYDDLRAEFEKNGLLRPAEPARPPGLTREE